MNPSSPYPSHNAQSHQQAINPALLGTYPAGPGMNVNPNKFPQPGNMNSNQLMNGMSMGGMNPMSSGIGSMGMGPINSMGMGLNPNQLLQQPQHAMNQHHQRNMMHGSMNPLINGPANMLSGMMNIGGMNAMMSSGQNSMNQATLASMGNGGNDMMSSPSAMVPEMSLGMGNGMSTMTSSGINLDGRQSGMGMGYGNGQQSFNQMNMNPMPMMVNSNMGGGIAMNPSQGNPGMNSQSAMMLSSSGISREQFANMSQQERQIFASKLMMHAQSRNQHSPPQFDRPTSSASQQPSSNPLMSNGMGPSQGMMPPPDMLPQRPPTAQSNRSSMPPNPSRPPTAMDGRSRGTSVSSPHVPNMAPMTGMPIPGMHHRPPSRNGSENMMGLPMSVGRPPSTPQVSHHPSIPSMPDSPSPFGLTRPGTGGPTADMSMSNNTMDIDGMGMSPAGNAGRSMVINGDIDMGGIPGTGMNHSNAPVNIPMAMSQTMPGEPTGQPRPRSGLFGHQNNHNTRPSSSGSGMMHQDAPTAGIPMTESSRQLSGSSMDTNRPPSRLLPLNPQTTSAAKPASSASSSHPNAKLNPMFTKIENVPLIDSLKLIRELSKNEIADVKGWMQTDQEYYNVYRSMQERMRAESRKDPTAINWWERGTAAVNPGIVGGRWRGKRETFDVRYPRNRKEKDGGSRSRRGVRREGLRLPQRIGLQDSRRPEELVPIRLEFDVDHHRMRDTFVWNVNDPIVTPEDFAQSLVEDYNLNASYHATITRSIQEQLSDYKAHSNHFDGEAGEFLGSGDTIKCGSLEDKDAEWWESWRKRLRNEYMAGRSRNKRRKVVKMEHGTETAVESERPMNVEEIEVHEDLMREEMRILVKLDITVGSVKLDDQFEWDLDNDSASPELFAEAYAQELGLGGEFKTAISHCIREQVHAYQKSLFLVGHSGDGSTVPDEDLAVAFLPNLTSAARSADQVQLFTPLLNYVSDGEVERNEKERDKEMNRRRKRNTRGKRGIILPDRDALRTNRTPAVGFPELDAATAALAAAATAPTSRRAAAAAASLTIANMVASENGQPILTNLPSAPQPPPSAPKKKPPKGLFKAPTVDQSVYRPRARVQAPTMSTAADASEHSAPLFHDPPLPPGMSNADIRAEKIATARRTKELEREARDKEFAEGQHSNMHDGIWHCSNCGCPETIAVGRRKGPLGDKTQCGTCGKYWHQHRRPRPVEYTRDYDHHDKHRHEHDSPMPKSMNKKRNMLRGSVTVPSTPYSEPQSPNDKDSLPVVHIDRALSPVSSASSVSDQPVPHTKKTKANGISHSPKKNSASQRNAPAVKEESAATGLPDAPTTRAWNAQPTPEWIEECMVQIRSKYPNDRVEVTLRRVNDSSPAEWRIKCLDCPGKLYKPGPSETLSNFEVHLKNRQHRQRVDDRIAST